MASIQSHFEINVAQHGQHLFATADRSIIFENKARALVLLFREKFPVEQGYDVSCSYIQCGSKKTEF